MWAPHSKHCQGLQHVEHQPVSKTGPLQVAVCTTNSKSAAQNWGQASGLSCNGIHTLWSGDTHVATKQMMAGDPAPTPGPHGHTVDGVPSEAT